MQLIRLFQLLFWGAMTFALVMASLPQPPALPGSPSDKTLHIIAFIVLAALAAFAYPRLPLLGLFAGLAVFGGIIELVQSIPQLGREASLTDWLADLLAAATTLLMLAVFRHVLGRKLS